MAAVMSHLERLPKRGKNKHFGYDYVTDSDVLDAVRKAMAQESVAFFVNVDAIRKESKYTVADLSLTFADGSSGASKTIRWTGEALDTQDKGINKAITAGVKYALLKTFLVSTGEEDDPDGQKPVRPGNKQATKEAKREWPPQIVQAIVDANLAAPARHAVHMLNLSDVLRTTDELEFILTWANHYRGQREAGKSPEESARYADEQMPKPTAG
jgi:hypothetical protein